MRILGLDYGDKTIGVAISDGLGLTAQGVETIVRTDPKNLKSSLKRLKEIADQYGVQRIVVGYPINMNNTLGQRTESTDYFCNRVRAELMLPVEKMDERLTTIAADRILEQGRVKAKDRKKYIDKIAAVLILETYLARYQ